MGRKKRGRGWGSADGKTPRGRAGDSRTKTAADRGAGAAHAAVATQYTLGRVHSATHSTIGNTFPIPSNVVDNFLPRSGHRSTAAHALLTRTARRAPATHRPRRARRRARPRGPHPPISPLSAVPRAPPRGPRGRRPHATPPPERGLPRPPPRLFFFFFFFFSLACRRRPTGKAGGARGSTRAVRRGDARRGGKSRPRGARGWGHRGAARRRSGRPPARTAVATLSSAVAAAPRRRRAGGGPTTASGVSPRRPPANAPPLRARGGGGDRLGLVARPPSLAPRVVVSPHRRRRPRRCRGHRAGGCTAVGRRCVHPPAVCHAATRPGPDPRSLRRPWAARGAARRASVPPPAAAPTNGRRARHGVGTRLLESSRRSSRCPLITNAPSLPRGSSLPSSTEPPDATSPRPVRP